MSEGGMCCGGMCCGRGAGLLSNIGLSMGRREMMRAPIISVLYLSSAT